MAPREGISWQLILADLALILFLVAVSAISDDEDALPSDADVPAQAIYRPRSGTPDIALWLEQQAPDPRMTLTIVATHDRGNEDAAWLRANALAKPARESGISVRVVTREGSEADLYARLGFDDVT